MVCHLHRDVCCIEEAQAKDENGPTAHVATVQDAVTVLNVPALAETA